MSRESGKDSPLCFFFGCGSIVEDTLCLDRAGTGIVGRVVKRGCSTTVVVPGVGSGPGSDMEIGRRGDPVVSMGSLSGGGRAGIGRRFGSGLITMWDGMPPCDTMVGGGPDVGKGTKVCKPLEAGRSRRKYAGGKESSYSMDGSKKGKSPAKWLRCIIARARWW